MPDGAATTAHRPSLSQGMIVLFAVACGLSVANLYYAQPILDTIAKAFGTSSGTAGLVVTFSQIGYAAGLALLVPLGDLVSRRRLVPIVLLVTAGGLVASALGARHRRADRGGADRRGRLGGGAAPGTDGRAPGRRRAPGPRGGMVMSGLLIGILLARTVSGVVAEVSSWRVVYVMAAGMTAVLAVVLSRLLPAEGPRPASGTGRCWAARPSCWPPSHCSSVVRIFGALGFAAFSVFWTTMAFLLAGAPYHYGDLIIGLFGLVGASWRPVRQLRRSVGRPGVDQGHHPGLRRRCWPSRSGPCGSVATTWPC